VRLTGHRDLVRSLAFSPDGQMLASGSQDRTARLWNWTERRETRQLTDDIGAITSVAFSPDGRVLAMSVGGGAGRIIRLVDVATGSRTAELRGHRKSICSLAFTPDGHTLFSASDDGTIRVWDVVPRAKEEVTRSFAENSICLEWRSHGPALFLSPDARHLVTVYTDQTFSLWDTLRFAEGERHPLPFTNTTTTAVAPGGRLAAFASRHGEVTLWDADTGQARFFAKSDTNSIHRLVFSSDGRYLAVGDDAKTLSQMATAKEPKRTVRVWEVGARKQTHLLSPDGEFPISLKFSDDAKALLAGFWRGGVKLWELDGSGRSATFPGHPQQAGGVVLLPDGKTLVSVGRDIRFWDVPTRRETDKLTPRTAAYRIALSPDGRRFATAANDGPISIWDVTSHEEVATLEGHQETVTQMAFTPDGDHLVSVSKDQLRVWRAPSWAEIKSKDYKK
jgi:WD40 repeat protein